MALLCGFSASCSPLTHCRDTKSSVRSRWRRSKTRVARNRCLLPNVLSELDRDYSVTVLVPPSKPRTPNETSLLIIGRDRVKNSAFLITGDVPAGMLPQMLAQLPNHVDVLQAPHHGADPGLLQLISHTDPDYVVISANAISLSDELVAAQTVIVDAVGQVGERAGLVDSRVAGLSSEVERLVTASLRDTTTTQELATQLTAVNQEVEQVASAIDSIGAALAAQNLAGQLAVVQEAIVAAVDERARTLDGRTGRRIEQVETHVTEGVAQIAAAVAGLDPEAARDATSASWSRRHPRSAISRPPSSASGGRSVLSTSRPRWGVSPPS